MGTPMIIAPAVTYKEPSIMGNIPKDGGTLLGDQSLPSRNVNIPISAIAGRPLANMKKQIRITEIMEAQADIKNTISINFSKNFDFIFIPTLFTYFAPGQYFTDIYIFYLFNRQIINRIGGIYYYCYAVYSYG